MTCRVQARGELIDLGARQRIRRLFGERPSVTEIDIPPAPARPIHDGEDVRPCDSEPPA